MVGSESLKFGIKKYWNSAGLSENIETYDFVGEPTSFKNKGFSAYFKL